MWGWGKTYQGGGPEHGLTGTYTDGHGREGVGMGVRTRAKGARRPSQSGGSSGASPSQVAIYNRSSAVQATGVATHVRMANSWRDQWNPLRGLTIQQAVGYLEAGERGEYADLQWLYRHVEKRDATLFGLIERYVGKIKKMDWTISVCPEEDLPKGATPEMAEAQREHLAAVYWGIQNMREAIEHLVKGRFRGYAHLEKIYGGDRLVPKTNLRGGTDGGSSGASPSRSVLNGMLAAGAAEREWVMGTEPRTKLTSLMPVEQWYWVRNGPNGVWTYNRETRSGTRVGEEVPFEKFIIREMERPVNELGLINYIFKNVAKKDWVSFVETYGIPFLFVIMPPNVPADKAAEYQELAEQVISDARGALPNGADVKTENAGTFGRAGGGPFKDLMQWLNEEVILAGTGGKLTMLAESGSGTLAGGAHTDSWEEIVLGEAASVSEVFQCQIDREEISRVFPGQPVLAYFELDFTEESEATMTFKREVWKGMHSHATTNAIATNAINVGDLAQNLGLPANTEYDEPYLPVKDEQGNAVTGEVLRDSEGDIVGGETEEPQQEGAEERRGEPDSFTEGNEGNEGKTLNRGSSGGASARPQSRLIQNAREVLAKALSNDLAPVRERLERILEITDEAVLKNRLTAFLAELPGLVRDLSKDPESARVLEQLNAAAFFTGATNKKAKSILNRRAQRGAEHEPGV